MSNKKDTGIKPQELEDIQIAIINMFKHGYLRGYIKGKNIPKGTEKEIWKDIKEDAWREFQKITQTEVKGGKKKKK
ncbi:MAG: hypothetical protein ACOCT9_00615 [archaeon]